MRIKSWMRATRFVPVIWNWRSLVSEGWNVFKITRTSPVAPIQLLSTPFVCLFVFKLCVSFTITCVFVRSLEIWKTSNPQGFFRSREQVQLPEFNLFISQDDLDLTLPPYFYRVNCAQISDHILFVRSHWALLLAALVRFLKLNKNMHIHLNLQPKTPINNMPAGVLLHIPATVFSFAFSGFVWLVIMEVWFWLKQDGSLLLLACSFSPSRSHDGCSSSGLPHAPRGTTCQR